MLPPTNKKPITKKRHSLRRLVFLTVLLLVGTGLASQRQQLYDYSQLRNYKAPNEVASLANQDGMTPYARKIYYVNHPMITSGSNFIQACPNNGGEKTIVLGCYRGGQRGIVLLGVGDPLLNGVEQVTAAHEMLHAAYDRLSASERTKVDAMLQDYYQHKLHDTRLLAIIDAYKLSEPNDVVNEMHSVFGTEISQLPKPLEQYYQRYFTNRSQVTGYAAQYQAEFTNRQTIVAQDDVQLASLKVEIDATIADLQSKLAVINARQADLSRLRSDDVYAYNAGVPAYNRLVDSYNNEARSLQASITRYNQLVASRNAVALEVDQLAKELSSSAAPINK